LVVDSAKSTNDDGRHRNDYIYKYRIIDPLEEPLYWKSRRGKDNAGNNTLHFAFKITDRKIRDDVLRLLIKEECGHKDKRNLLGYLPHEIVHDQPI
jgi:hypothetical protein